MLCFLMAAAGGSVLISGSHAWDFKLPKSLDLVPQLAERAFFNYTTVASAGNLAVINKTTTAYAAGIILASSFLAGTLIYNLEENRSSSAKLSNRESDGFLSTFFSSDSSSSSDDLTENDSDSEGSKKGRKRRKKKVDGNSEAEAVVCNDCETYCSNKYYYGDPYHSYVMTFLTPKASKKEADQEFEYYDEDSSSNLNYDEVVKKRRRYVRSCYDMLWHVTLKPKM